MEYKQRRAEDAHHTHRRTDLYRHITTDRAEVDKFSLTQIETQTKQVIDRTERLSVSDIENAHIHIRASTHAQRK